MNHLVHLFLSGTDEKIIIGNLLYDFLAWRDMQKLDISLDPGFDLHVLIDTYTDSHELIKSGTARLHPHFNKFAPVVVDIYYDHLLYLN
jgi:acyl carrier protein phosphodiesterase